MMTGACLTWDETREPMDEVAKIEDLRMNDLFSLRSRVKNRVSKVLQWGQDYKCYFCEKVAEFVFTELKTEKTREFIRHLVEKSCSRLFKKEERGKLIFRIHRSQFSFSLPVTE